MRSLREERTRTSRPSPSVRTIDQTVTPSHSWTLHRLPSREMKRRFWHMCPGMLAFALHLVPHADPISPTLRLIILVFGVVISLRILLGFRLIQRQGESTGAAAVSGYVFSVLTMVLAFPQHLELGLSVLCILAFGDGSATLVGLTFRGPRLPWNRGKSWSGLFGFVVIGTLMTSWMYWGETCNPEAADVPVSFGQAILLTFPAVTASAFAESIRSRVNDNVRVGIVAAISIALLQLFRPL